MITPPTITPLLVAELLVDASRRQALGERARALLESNRGAVGRTVDALVALVA